MRRTALRRLDESHNSIVSGVWANMNYDSKDESTGKSYRPKILEDIRRQIEEERAEIYEPGSRAKREASYESDPFFRSVRNMDRLYRGVSGRKDPGSSFVASADLDQLETP